MSVLIIVAAIAHGLAGPPVTPVRSPSHAWFPIVLVSVKGESLHPIGDGRYVPAIFYADRASCMTATRANVRPMHDAGITGRFLCMYHNEPDATLDRAPRENF
jgi:hypothetical protein